MNTVNARRFVSLTIIGLLMLTVGLMSSSVFADDTGLDTKVCPAGTTSMDVTDRGEAVVYSTADGGTDGTLFLGKIALSSIRHITEAERASGETIWITDFDSDVLSGWHVDIYWKNNYYGVRVTDPDGYVDDTGATCVL